MTLKDPPISNLIPQKEVELRHMLLLNTNRNSFMGNPVTLLDLIVTLKGQLQVYKFTYRYCIYLLLHIMVKFNESSQHYNVVGRCYFSLSQSTFLA